MLRRIVVLLFSLGVLTMCMAQYSSNIQGIVQDPSRGAIPNAPVVLRNLGTEVTQTTKSSDSGFYRFSSLPPGRYEVSAEAQGFRKQAVEVSLLTAQTTDLPLTLAVAGVQEAVEVQAVAPAIDTADSRIQATIRTESLQDLPFKGRNVYALAAVAPGVTGFMAGSLSAQTAGESEAPDNFSPAKIVNVSANGRSYIGNQFIVDGLDTGGNIVQGSVDLSPNPDAIDELTIQTNSFSAENGKASSLAVTITTKSGTNEFHGTGSYFFTNQNLWARTIFTNKYEPFKRHDLSGTLGGPIIKNKTFFFASAETLRAQISQATGIRTYESPDLVAWAKQKYPNSIGTKLLTDYPIINVGTTGVRLRASDVFGAECNSASTDFIPCSLPMVMEGQFKPSPFRNGLQYSFRGDQYLNGNKDRIYGNYYKAILETENPAIRTSMTSINKNDSWATQANWTHTFGPTLLNEAAFGMTYVDGTNVISGPFHLPEIGIGFQGTGLGPGWGPGTFAQHNYNWKDVIGWVRGSHALKIGVQIYHGDDGAYWQRLYSRPTFSFNNLLDLVRDQPFSESGVAYDPLTGKPTQLKFVGQATNKGIFIQDEWKVKPNLTLSLGFRWDDFGNPYGKDGFTYSNIFLGNGSTNDEKFKTASIKKTQNAFAGRLNNNFSPRVGFAWDPSRNGKWVIRGGMGFYHDWVTLGESIDQIGYNPPGFLTPYFAQTTAIKPLLSIGTSDEFPYGFQYPAIPNTGLNEFGGLVGVQAGVGGLDRNLVASKSINYAIGVERQFAGKLIAGINHTGSKTWDGIIGTDFNRFAGDLLDGKLDRLNPNFGSMGYRFNNNEMRYNSMILTLRSGMGAPVQFQSSYTLGHVTDYGQAGARTLGGGGFPDQHNIKSYNAGDANWDVRHRFSFSGFYHIPAPGSQNPLVKNVLGGWELTTVAIVQSGTPFSVVNYASFQPVRDASGNVIGLKTGSGDYNADGTNYDYPMMPSGQLDAYTGSHSRQEFLSGIFTGAVLTAPAIGSSGNLKRNIFRNPGAINIDSGLIKNNALRMLGERGNLQLRFDFFNVLNRVNLGGVDGSLTSATFGRVTGTREARIIQLGARIVF